MINTLTLSPAIDIIIYLNNFKRNITNRIGRTETVLGGKGTHVSLDLMLMGETSRAFGFGFGKTGMKIVDMLEAHGVKPFYIYGEIGESRTNYIVVEDDTRDASLLADKGPRPTPEMIEALCLMIGKTVRPGDYLALSGNASTFADPDIYNKVSEILKDRGVRIFLDADGATLKKCVAESPFLIKPNLKELSALMDEELVSDADVVRAISALDKYNIENIAVSLGEDGAIVKAGDALYRVGAPKVKLYNAVGCGNCFVSGLLYGFGSGLPIEETLRYATAAAASTAESPLSVYFDPKRAKAFMPEVEIKRM